MWVWDLNSSQILLTPEPSLQHLPHTFFKTVSCNHNWKLSWSLNTPTAILSVWLSIMYHAWSMGFWSWNRTSCVLGKHFPTKIHLYQNSFFGIFCLFGVFFWGGGLFWVFLVCCLLLVYGNKTDFQCWSRVLLFTESCLLTKGVPECTLMQL